MFGQNTHWAVRQIGMKSHQIQTENLILTIVKVINLLRPMSPWEPDNNHITNKQNNFHLQSLLYILCIFTSTQWISKIPSYHINFFLHKNEEKNPSHIQFENNLMKHMNIKIFTTNLFMIHENVNYWVLLTDIYQSSKLRKFLPPAHSNSPTPSRSPLHKRGS